MLWVLCCYVMGSVFLCNGFCVPLLWVLCSYLMGSVFLCYGFCVPVLRSRDVSVVAVSC